MANIPPYLWELRTIFADDCTACQTETRFSFDCPCEQTSPLPIRRWYAGFIPSWQPLTPYKSRDFNGFFSLHCTSIKWIQKGCKNEGQCDITASFFGVHSYINFHDEESPVLDFFFLDEAASYFHKRGIIGFASTN